MKAISVVATRDKETKRKIRFVLPDDGEAVGGVYLDKKAYAKAKTVEITLTPKE